MAERRPIVNIAGVKTEMPSGDTLPSDIITGATVSTTQTVDFGSTFTDKAELVVTGQSWVTVNSEIVPQIKVPSGVDADEIRLLELKPEISNLVNGTGFTLTVYSEPEATGTYDVMCIGV